MNYLAIVQARLGSSRLPKKVLLDLAGRPILKLVYERLKASRRLDEVVIATTIAPEDTAVVAAAVEMGARVYVGSESDVLDRYYQAARLLLPENVVRVTADCPLIDPEVLDECIELHEREGADYTSNTIEPSYPDGLDVEVFCRSALERAWKEARLGSEREHVTPYIKKHPELFRLARLINQDDHSDLRWTIDEAEDYQFLTSVFANAGPQGPTELRMKDVLAFLQDNPDVQKINQQIGRDEGYQKSLAEDEKQEQ